MRLPLWLKGLTRRNDKGPQKQAHPVGFLDSNTINKEDINILLWTKSASCYKWGIHKSWTTTSFCVLGFGHIVWILLIDSFNFCNMNHNGKLCLLVPSKMMHKKTNNFHFPETHLILMQNESVSGTMRQIQHRSLKPVKNGTYQSMNKPYQSYKLYCKRGTHTYKCQTQK